MFQWVSQNRHTQEGKIGKILKNHQLDGVLVHLFVRKSRLTQRGKAAPFRYCGVAEFVDWEGSKPITIRWRLKERVPEYLHEAYGIQNHE
jgi:hypothetical protein